MTCNLGNGSTSLASLALEEIESGFIFSLNLCLIASAILAPYIVFDVFSNEPQEMLCLISSDQNHFVVKTDVSLTTELGHEVIHYMLMLSVDCLNLGIKIDPCTLGPSSGALWLDQSELPR